MDNIKSIEGLHNYLIKNLKKIHINEYIEIIYNIFYSHLKILNINELNSLTTNLSYIINEEYLVKYELLNDNFNDKDINDLFKDCRLEIERDYRIRKVSIKDARKGVINKFNYRLTSVGFKRCLIHKHDNYKLYYILLEEWLNNYSKYQEELYRTLIEINDIRITTLQDKLIMYNDLMINKLDKININTEKLSNNISSNINDILDDININTQDLLNIQYLSEERNYSKNKKIDNNYKCIIYKIDNNKYYLLESNASIIMKKYKKIMYKFKYLDEIYSIDYKINNNSMNITNKSYIIPQIIQKFNNLNTNEYSIKISNNIISIINIKTEIKQKELIQEIITFINTLI